MPISTGKPAVASGFEVKLGGDYAHITGNAGNIDVGDVIGEGGRGELKLGARVTPYVSLGAYGTLGGFSNSNELRNPIAATNVDIWDVSAGLFTELHFAPYSNSVDPWLGIGVGWHAMWFSPNNDAPSSSLQGFDVAKVQIGADFRVTPDVAIAPVVGAGLTLFAWEKVPGVTNGFDEINDKDISVYLTAGLQGRFNFGSRYSHR
ncbi:MAG: hypothetical protein ACTHU0_39805 [Kofleriaceae bacterium]